MNGLMYDIQLLPDLTSFTFQGSTAVTINDPSQIINDKVTLNAHQLEIMHCRVDGVPTDGVVDVDAQTITIFLPATAVTPLTIHFTYNGRINDQYAGLYRSRYQHDGQEKWLATTQFQASDARRVFPCFDHPAQKATFDLALIIDAGLTAVANTPIAEISPLPDGKQNVRFKTTPPMSPYLLFMGIGEFESISSNESNPQVRVLTTPGKSGYGRFALEMGQQSLQFCAAYTNIPYALEKCDFIAVPDSIGAMENYGAIRHSENLLLAYPETSTASDLVRIGSIIAHEASHMWFGNLVGLADWKYLWLNEAFATYFTYTIPDHLHPEWFVWHDFAGEALLSGLERDALLNSVPIELSPEAALDRDPAPTPSSAPIIYHKGAAVLRMLADYIGEEAFKRGLNFYLYRYQNDSVTSAQFWTAMATAVATDLTPFATSWMFQPGFPLLTASRSGNTVHLRQQRFTFLVHESPARWAIPVTILCYLPHDQVEHISLLFDSGETAVDIPAQTIAYKLNPQQVGFYRVLYADDNLAALGALIREGRVTAVDRFNLQNDLFALVRRGDISVGHYLDFVAHYFATETSYLPLNDILKNLQQLQLLLPPLNEEIKRVGQLLCTNALATIGFASQADDDRHRTQLRNNLLWVGAFWGLDEAIRFGLAQFTAWIEGTAVAPDIRASALKIGAAYHPQGYKQLTSQLASGAIAEAELSPLLEALAGLPNVTLLRQTLDFSIATLPKNQRGHLIQSAAQNPAASGLLWPWFMENMAELRHLHPAILTRLLATLIPVCGLDREDEVRDFCHGFVTTHPHAADSLTMALEKLTINKNLRSRENG